MHIVTWFTPMFPGNMTLLKKPGNIVYFLTSCNSRWTNHDRLLTMTSFSAVAEPRFWSVSTPCRIFPNSQGSAATQLRCGGKYYVHFVENFRRFSAVEKIVKICYVRVS